jgi:hypothetical protein
MSKRHPVKRPVNKSKACEEEILLVRSGYLRPYYVVVISPEDHGKTLTDTQEFSVIPPPVTITSSQAPMDVPCFDLWLNASTAAVVILNGRGASRRPSFSSTSWKHFAAPNSLSDSKLSSSSGVPTGP